MLRPRKSVDASVVRRRLGRADISRTHQPGAVVEPVEKRVMFAISATGQAFSPGVAQLVFTDIQDGSTNGSSATAAQTVTLRNTGVSAVTINSASIIDDPATPGDHASQFEAVSFPTFPASIPAGASITLNVRFRASDVGLKAALLRVNGSLPVADVYLRGIGTTSESSGDVGGNTEASLQRILNAFQIPVNVGDTNGEDTFDLPTPRPEGTVHDEVEMQRLVKAGVGPVTIQPLAEYAFNTKTGPVAHLGYYTPGTTGDKTELFAIDVDERTSTNPSWNGSFDPGDAAFALYGDFNGSFFEINGLPRGVYSEDLFNTWDETNKRKVRFFPLKNKDGSVVENAFIFAFEEFNAGYDSNDVVGIIRNVKAAPTGPEIGTENLDRNFPGPKALTFSRISVQPPTDDEGNVLPNNVVHNKAKVRVYNSGTSTMTISSATVDAPADFNINTANLAGSTVLPGAFRDIEVQFIATDGHFKTGTLTINTDDADEPSTVIQLRGFRQNRSEKNEEPTVAEVLNLFGYKTKLVNNGETLFVEGEQGKVSRVGEEILSPYWRRADGAAQVSVTQIAAYHDHNTTETISWHHRSSFTTNKILTHDELDAQSVLPHLNDSNELATATFKPGAQGNDANPAFGFKVQGEWSDPTRNVQEKSGGGYGHRVRFWPLRDADGVLVPNTYVMAMDYLGINYDYNDNTYIISNITPADPVDSAPTAPANLTATGLTSGVGLNWSPNADVVGWNVYRGATADFTPSASNKLNSTLITVSDYKDVDAPIGTEVFYKVTAVDPSATEGPAASASGTRTAEPTPEAGTPTGLVATPLSQTSVSVSWSPSANATGYILERRTGADAFAAVSAELGETSFNDTTVSPSTRYEYRVIAVNSIGVQSAPSDLVVVDTPGVSVPTVPAVSVGDLSIAEPTSGNATANFLVTLDQSPTGTIVVSYSTVNGTARSGSDYTSTNGTLTFSPGQTSQTVAVTVASDNANDANETFSLNVTLVSGDATIADGEGTATITGGGNTGEPPTPQPIQAIGGKNIATFTGGNGKPVKISLKGPGTGQVTLLDGGGVDITLTDTTTASSLTISGETFIRNLTASGALKSFSGKAVDLTGAFAVSQAIGKLLFQDASGAATLNVGPGGSLSIAMANAAELNITSASPVKSLKANQWLDGSGTGNVFSAPSISSVTVKGNFTADIVTTELTKMSVTGAITDSDIRASGNIGTVRAGSMTGSRLFAGVKDAITTLPDSADDFSVPATMKSVTVSSKAPGAFSNSLIAAMTVGKLSLGNISTSNSGTPFGLAGDIVGSVRATVGGTPFSAKKLTETSSSTTEGDFVLRVL